MSKIERLRAQRDMLREYISRYDACGTLGPQDCALLKLLRDIEREHAWTLADYEYGLVIPPTPQNLF